LTLNPEPNASKERAAAEAAREAAREKAAKEASMAARERTATRVTKP